MYYIVMCDVMMTFMRVPVYLPMKAHPTVSTNYYYYYSHDFTIKYIINLICIFINI